MPASGWLAQLGDAVGYMHWSDNRGDLDSELPLGDGTVDWISLLRQTVALNGLPTIVLEANQPDATTRNIELLISRGSLE